jgi:molybdenum cofactor cytidylyltransferase
VLILPVDHPLISSALIRALMKAFEESGKKIIIPVYEARRGHPLIISSELFPEIKNASPAVGLREVIRSHAIDIGVVPTAEEGILLNIDTPDDYERYIAKIPVE